jgi:hypothetical protein
MRNMRRVGWTTALATRDRAWPAVLAATAVVTVAAVLAGCGTARARQGASGTWGSAQAPAAGTPAQAPASGPPSGPPSSSRAQALALARRLLSHLVLPAGARPAHVSPLPPEIRTPANSIIGSADVHQLFVLRQQMPAAHHFLLVHVPAGMRRDSTGQGNGPAGITMESVGYAPLSLPSGISQAELAATVVPGSAGGSLLRADAQVSWFPPRTAAEHLDPAGLASVTVVATLPTSPNRRPPAASRVFTSPAVLARLARLLNGLPAAAQPRVTGCPASAATYTLRFTATDPGSIPVPPPPPSSMSTASRRGPPTRARSASGSRR